MLEFNSSQWENFQSFYGAHSFTYKKSGMHLISGVNLDHEGDIAFKGQHSVGSGKSSFTMIPQFALFGDVIKKGNCATKKDDIINKTAKRNLKVALDFSVDGERFLVERFRKHKEGKNGVRLYERAGGDWHDITQSDVYATQRAINELLPWNEDTFTKVVVLSREDLKQFLDYGAPDRWRIFESIIKLDKLKDYRETLRKNKKESNDELNEITLELTSFTALANRASLQAQEESDDNKIKKLQLNKEIKDLEKKIKKIMTTDSIKNVVKKAEQVYILGQQLSDVEKNEKKVIKLYETLKSDINDRKIQIRVAKDKLAESKKYLQTIKPITCHKCGAAQNSKNFKKTKEGIQSDIDYTKSTLVDHQSSLDKLNLQINKARSVINKTHDKKVVLIEKIEKIKILKEYKTTILKDAKDNKQNKTVDELKKLSHNITLKKHELNIINDIRVKKLKAEAKTATANVTKFKAKQKKLNKILEEINFMDKALDVREENSIKQYAVSTIMPVFNELLRDNLDNIFLDELILSLDPFFNDTIIYNGHPYNYSQLSTGERVKLNLSVNFTIFDAMRLHVMGSSAIWLDEIYTNVDIPSIQAFTNLIKNKYSKESAVYTITHQQEAIEYINPQTITTIVKENGFSRIETT